jgi:hypothetical protein
VSEELPGQDQGETDLGRVRRPFYSRLLGLRHLRLRGWQRAVLAEGSLAVAVLLVLADLATAWTLLVLPVAVAAVVKLHDVVAGLVPGGHTTTAPVLQDRSRREVRGRG